MSGEPNSETLNKTALGAEASPNEAKARKSLDDRIVETEAELKRLKDAKRKREQAERERNEREVLALLNSEKLIAIPSTAWRQALPGIKTALERAARA